MRKDKTKYTLPSHLLLPRLIFSLSFLTVAQRGSGDPIPRRNQGQVGRGSEQPDVVEDVPAHCRGVGYMTSKGPFQPKAFYDLYDLFFLLPALSGSGGWGMGIVVSL